MCKILLLLTIFISSLAQAQNYSNFYSYCILKKAGNFDYLIDQVPEVNREMYTHSNALSEALYVVSERTIRGTARAFSEARNIVSLLTTGKNIEGKRIRNWTISALKDEIKKRRLDQFEKASLINCATFSLIYNRSNSEAKFGSLLDVYEIGEGICTEQAEVARDLGEAVGLKVRVVTSEWGHTWPEYKIDGTWYILDPLSNGNYFYEALSQ